nr:uncharacterized protein LOC108171426 [Malus domestica]
MEDAEMMEHGFEFSIIFFCRSGTCKLMAEKLHALSSLATFLLILSRRLCFLFPTEWNSKLCISRFHEKVPNTAASGDGSSNGTFFRAVLLVRRGKYDEAREYVERARKCLATELAALMDTSEDFENVFLANPYKLRRKLMNTSILYDLMNI